MLTEHEVAALNMYTIQSPFYVDLNKALRSRNRNLVKPFFPYLNLLITALFKLHGQQGGLKTRSLYRGVRLDLSQHFLMGAIKFFWAVTSTSGVMVRVPHVSGGNVIGISMCNFIDVLH